MNVERLEALDRQSLLFKNRCLGCPYRKKANRWEVYAEDCYRCPIRDEFLEIGEILMSTLNPRKEIEGEEEAEQCQTGAVF